MPKIQAFRGLRYNLAQVGSLSEVVTPPYDVIDEKMHQDLLAANPFNYVRLELPVGQAAVDSGTGEDAAYQSAAQLFRQWIRDGVLQFEPDPALYVYHQVFDFEGRTYTRRGFLTRIGLEPFGEGKVFPHEETHAKAKDDRLRLTRACEANMSPVFGIYPDPLNEVQNILEAHTVGQAALEAIDADGVSHRVWPVTDQSLIGQAAMQIEDRPLFIADGHHRYETACNYRDSLAAEGELNATHPANFVLGLVMSMDDPGLQVLPTHRLFSGVGSIDAQQLKSAVGDCFECEPYGSGPEAAEQVWQQIQEIDDQGVMGIFTAADQAWTLVSVTEKTAERMKELEPEKSARWRSLGVSILHRLLIDELLQMRDHPKPTYVHEVREVAAELSSGRFPLAALVMPASVDDVRAISEAAERMPAKSTYFYPKLLSGLVVNPLDCS